MSWRFFLGRMLSPWTSDRDPRQIASNQQLNSRHWRTVKMLRALTDDLRYELQTAPQGYFRFVEWKLRPRKKRKTSLEQEWRQTHHSGIYDTIEAVERSARSFTKLELVIAEKDRFPDGIDSEIQ